MVDLENKEGFENQHKKNVEAIGIPLIYGNVISVGLTLTDVHINISVNNKPAFLLAVPLPTAKSLGENLVSAIKEYESKTGTQVLSLEQLSGKASKS